MVLVRHHSEKYGYKLDLNDDKNYQKDVNGNISFSPFFEVCINVVIILFSFLPLLIIPLWRSISDNNTKVINLIFGNPDLIFISVTVALLAIMTARKGNNNNALRFFFVIVLLFLIVLSIIIYSELKIALEEGITIPDKALISYNVSVFLCLTIISIVGMFVSYIIRAREK